MPPYFNQDSSRNATTRFQSKQGNSLENIFDGVLKLQSMVQELAANQQELRNEVGALHELVQDER